MNSTAQNFIGSKEDIDVILNSKKDFSINFMNRDFEKVTNRYISDAKLFPNAYNIIERLKGINEYWTYPKNVKILNHKITPLEIRVTNDYAHAYGTFISETLTADGQRISGKGKYVKIWRKEGEHWKVYLEIWNANP